MAVREELRRGKRVLVLDIRYRNPDGTWARYRRDAEAATKTAARDEERRIRDHIARTGSPFEEPPPEEAPAPAVVSFGEIAARYRASYMVTDLKVTSRRGYEKVIENVLLPRFRDRPITAVDGKAASELDRELALKISRKKSKLSRGTRNNVQVVLRSVLRFALREGALEAMPAQLPRLKRIGQTILEIPTDEEVARILAAAAPQHRLVFALMAYAGLRPNEVRALKGRDVSLRRQGEAAVGGFLSVREGVSFRETHTPKTGQREIPLAPVLAELLARGGACAREAYVARSRRGTPWGQYGLDQAFERVRNRVGLTGYSIYALRHYAITLWLRRGIPAHVVQKMAGHSNLATTQRYVHCLKGDLEEAAERLARLGNMWETPPGGASDPRGRAA
jgi:integrase